MYPVRKGDFGSRLRYIHVANYEEAHEESHDSATAKVKRCFRTDAWEHGRLAWNAGELEVYGPLSSGDWWSSGGG